MAVDKAFIIFSGNNQRAIIAFCRFCVANNIPFFIFSSGDNDPILTTNYKNKVVYTRKNRNLEYDLISNEIKKIKKKYKLSEMLILPSSEFLNRFLIEYKQLFQEDNIIIPLVEKKIYEEISDKFSFSNLCSEKGLNVPKESENYNDLGLPIVVKPKTYLNSDNEVQQAPKIISSSKDLLDIDVNNKTLYFQEYIDGKCFYLLYYISQSKNHVMFSQENLVQQGGGGSMIASRSSNLHNEPIAKEYLNLFLDIDFTGLIMIELKKYKDKYYMIEANPRLWGPSQLFLDANVPIFHEFVNELGFEINGISSTEQTAKYLWFGGIRKSHINYDELKYYNYSEEKFLEEVPQWLDHEIYRKPDTFTVFINENFK